MRTGAKALAVIGLAIFIGGFAAKTNAASSVDSYPEKPIRVIVPFAPGGSVDILARAIGQKVNENWAQPVVIETRPGASTMIGTELAARAEPDGYTLLMVVSNFATNPALHDKMPYDALKDFEPISLLARTPVVIFSHPSLPASDLKELLAIARDKPGMLNFGSAGPGSMTHLVAEMLKLQAKIEMTHVVYKGGASALTDLLGGQIPLHFATVSQDLPYYQAGQIRALGVTAAARYASIPKVPTFTEQGQHLVATEWYGIVAPAKTPKPILAKLNTEMRRVIALPNLGERVSSVELISSTPEELRQFVRSEIERWTPLIKKLGLKME